MHAAVAVQPGPVLLRGGTVLDVDGERSADIRVGADGRIAANGPAIEPAPGETVIDCTQRLVIPGGVDVHTHLHLPVGAVRVSDDFDSGTRAAAIGGTTTIVDYVTAYGASNRSARSRPGVAGPSRVRRLRPAHDLHRARPGGRGRGVRRGRRHLLQAVHGLSRAAPGRRRRDPRHHVDDAAARRSGHAPLRERRRDRSTPPASGRAGRTGVLEHATTRPAALEAEAVERAARLAEVADATVYVVPSRRHPRSPRCAPHASEGSTSSLRRAPVTSTSTPRA